MRNSMVPNSTRRRFSCLGCTVQVLGLFVLAGIGYLVIIAVLAPWMYYLGGGFHALPIWQGVGKIHTASGDYTLYLYLSEPGTSRFGYHMVSGSAQLCTPHGERFRYLRVIAYFTSKDFGLDSNHQPMTIYIHDYGAFGSVKTDHRPEFNLYGSWQDPDLALEDHGSLASAFLSDGQAYLGPPSDQPPAGQNISVTLVPGGPAQFKAACKVSGQ